MKTRSATFDGGAKRHEPSGVRGVSTSDWSQITASVLERAAELGFVRAGVATVEPLSEPIERLLAFVRKGRSGHMTYLSHRQPDGTLTRLDPKLLLPSAACVVVVALPYPSPKTVSGSAPSLVAGYARGADYHQVIKDKLGLLADSIADISGRTVVARACVDSAPLLERDLAVRAGFAFLGKNTLTIAPGAGSHFLLGELLVDAPLLPSGPSVPQGCGSCRACLDVCPTQAFVGPFELDATRCVSYLTIESSEDIPRSLRAGVGTRLFGCDECQAVCPYNAAPNVRPVAPELEAREEVSALTPEDVLAMGSSEYKRLVRGSALRRASRNQLARNAAIVLGNRGDESVIPLLHRHAQEHPSVQVRLHCIWALGTLLHDHGASSAREALDALAQTGSDELAREATLCLQSEAFEEARRAHPATDAHGDEGVLPLNSM